METFNERGLENLCNAVVIMAVNDYRKALVKQHKAKNKELASREVYNLEKFFKGDMFKIYSKLDGKTLMNQVKNEVIEYNYDLKELKKSHGERTA